MLRTLRVMACAAASLLLAAAAGAQSGAAPQSSSSTDSTRPATTTFLGDTGIWFVPTADVVPAGKWSVSGYRRGTDFQQGYTNVGDFAGTFSVGIKGRAEVFGSFLFDTRIDRDSSPAFFSDPTTGGVVDRHPLSYQPWSGDNVGDLYVGVKFSLMSEADRKAVS